MSLPLKHRLSALCAGLALLVPFAAEAATGYVVDKRYWMALSAEQKAGYAQGISDSVNYIFVDDPLANAVAKRGRTKCLAAQKTTPAVLADRITTAYNSDPRLSTFAPTAVYIIKMGEICRAYVNDERAAFNLPPQ